jgi:hypothetical protein
MIAFDFCQNLSKLRWSIALVSHMNGEIGVPFKFYLFSYPSQEIKLNEMNKKVELDGDIEVFQAWKSFNK